MPLYDYRCTVCDGEQELFLNLKDLDNKIVCECGGEMTRLFTIGHGAICHNDDADWLKSVTTVVDKDPNKPHCQEFLNNPTRSNYKKWLKGEGLRPLEPGEQYETKRARQQKVANDEKQLEQKVLENHKKRTRLKLGEKQDSHPAQNR